MTTYTWAPIAKATAAMESGEDVIVKTRYGAQFLACWREGEDGEADGWRASMPHCTEWPQTAGLMCVDDEIVEYLAPVPSAAEVLEEMAGRLDAKAKEIVRESVEAEDHDCHRHDGGEWFAYGDAASRLRARAAELRGEGG